MVEAGVVDDADYFACLHMGGPTLPLGEVALEATHFLSSVKMEARFRGVASHAGGAPERGRNALLAACQATLALHALPRNGQGATFVNVGVLNAGTGTNVVPSDALMKYEVRGGTDEICELMEEGARRCLSGAATLQGVDVSTEITGRTIGAKSDGEMKDHLAWVAGSSPVDFRIHDARPLGGRRGRHLLHAPGPGTRRQVPLFPAGRQHPHGPSHVHLRLGREGFGPRRHAHGRHGAAPDRIRRGRMIGRITREPPAPPSGVLRLRFATPVLSFVEGLRTNGLWMPFPFVLSVAKRSRRTPFAIERTYS